VNIRERIDELEETVRQYREVLTDAKVLSFWGMQPGEQKILMALYKAPNGFCTRDRLLAVLGGIESPIDHRNVDVRLCRLRAKIRPHGVEISTVQGEGYRLSPQSKAIIEKAMTEEYQPNPRSRKDNTPLQLSRLEVMLLVSIFDGLGDVATLKARYGSKSMAAFYMAIHRIREKLDPLEIRLKNQRSKGYWIDPDDRPKLIEAMRKWLTTVVVVLAAWTATAGPAPQYLVVTPDSMSTEGTVDGVIPDRSDHQLTATRGNVNWRLAVDSMPAWLTANTLSGRTPVTVTFVYNPRGLVEGEYAATITLQNQTSGLDARLAARMVIRPATPVTPPIDPPPTDACYLLDDAGGYLLGDGEDKLTCS